MFNFATKWIQEWSHWRLAGSCDSFVSEPEHKCAGIVLEKPHWSHSAAERD